MVKADHQRCGKSSEPCSQRDSRLCVPKSDMSKTVTCSSKGRYIVSRPRPLFIISVLTVLIVLGNLGSSVQANVVPSAPSDVVSHPANLVTTSTACGTDAEVEFIGLTVPTGQVLMITGFYFSATSTLGSDLYG